VGVSVAGVTRIRKSRYVEVDPSSPFWSVTLMVTVYVSAFVMSENAAILSLPSSILNRPPAFPLPLEPPRPLVSKARMRSSSPSGSRA
jgi:hypothetical protein